MLAIVAITACLTLLFGWDLATSNAGIIGRSLSRGFFLTSCGAFLVTSVPALFVMRRRPWAALGLVLLYPVAWIAILSQT